MIEHDDTGRDALTSARRRIAVLYMAGVGGEGVAVDLRLAIDEIDAALAVVRPAGVTVSREDIRNAVAPVLVNASSFPRKAQPHLLGQDMAPLIDRVVTAVVARLDAAS